MKISNRAASIQASPIRKLYGLANEAKAKGIKVYHVNIGQPDIPTPKKFLDAVKNYDEKVVAYAPSQGIEDCQKAYVKYYHHKGIKLGIENIVVTTGGSEALIFAFSIVADPGEEVLVFEPFYTNYNSFATLGGVKLRPILTKVEDGFHLPSEKEILSRITKKAKAIAICNPNNPTGIVLTPEELKMMVGVAKKKNLFLIADEVYSDFSFERKHRSALTFPEIKDRVIVIDSVSKKFSSCGARIGAIISYNQDVMASALKFGQARLSVATIEQVAMAKVIGNSWKYVKEEHDEYKKRRDVVYEGLKKIKGAVYSKPEGAFYNIVKLPIDSAEKFAVWLLTDFRYNGATVMVAPGPGFYATPGMGKSEIRLAYVLKSSDMKKAMEILVKGVEEYNRKKK